MLYQFIFFLAVLWTLATKRLDMLLYLCVIALGLYLILENYKFALLISVLVIGIMVGGYDNEGFENQEDSLIDVLKPKPILKIESDKKVKGNEKKSVSKSEPKSVGTNKNETDLLEKQLGKDAHIDAGTNFLKAYESLNPEQIESMRKDTTELIETQKVLMKTLTGMAPILENSQKMMSMFKGSFGDDFIKQAVSSVGGAKK
jgi:hypothetical protein